ncbi:hypothetical protein NHF40_10815 [Maricaulaceae bacterium EIL42A08]|nr:hypothetical protein [Maricaulaceae bacterium EIL42A08]MCP2678023.1 hypothetical protein [Maricaulaceae bacterium NA33B04]
MKRRITQVAIAVVAVVTLSACIIISSDSQELATAPQAPAETETEA